MERNYAIDFFKGLAIYFVVLIHTNPFTGARLFGIEGERIDFVIDTVARFAVPLFFAVSGYLLASKMSASSNPTKLFCQLSKEEHGDYSEMAFNIYCFYHFNEYSKVY